MTPPTPAAGLQGRATADRTGTTQMSSLPPVDDILERACRAPSVHNTQPWRWRVSGTRIDLYADFTRQLVYADPSRRDLVISCGAALHHLQVAAAGLGWSARVRRLPDAADERHIASVLLKPSRISPDAVELLRAIDHRRTDRRRLSSWPVPDERLNSLASTGSSWGAQVLPVPGESTKDRLHRLTRRADIVQNRNERYVAELAAWTGSSAGDGVPSAHIPSRFVVEPADALNRRFPGGELDDPVVEAEPSQDGMLIVCTSSDDTISRVRAGEALSAVWLHATRENLSVVPLSQAIEVDETRRRLQLDVLGDLAFPQILLRVGWLPITRSELAPTPRRPLDEVRVHV
jgi:nitroreductase